MIQGLLSISTEAAFALQVMRLVIIITEAVLSIALVITIFFQPANTTGISALDNSETYYTKNKKSSIEGKMKIATTVIAIAMVALAVAYFLTLCFSNAGVTA